MTMLTKSGQPRMTLRGPSVAKINARLEAESSPVRIVSVHGDLMATVIRPDTGIPVHEFEKIYSTEQAAQVIARLTKWHADRVGKRKSSYWIVEDVGRPRFFGEGTMTFAIGTDGKVTGNPADYRRFDKPGAMVTARQMNPGNGWVNFQASEIEEWI